MKAMWLAILLTAWTQLASSFPIQDDCAVPTERRIECGYYGISDVDCMSRGCCWQPQNNASETGSDIPWCFITAQEYCSLGDIYGDLEREECGHLGISRDECVDRHCCWLPSDQEGQPWCFTVTESASDEVEVHVDLLGDDQHHEHNEPFAHGEEEEAEDSSSGGVNSDLGSGELVEHVDLSTLTLGDNAGESSGEIGSGEYDDGLQAGGHDEAHTGSRDEEPEVLSSGEGSGELDNIDQADQSASGDVADEVGSGKIDGWQEEESLTRMTDVCDEVTDDEKFKNDCGYVGITEEECHSRNCCWKISTVPNIPWCYRRVEHSMQCVATSGRIDCGFLGIDEQECADRGCCWTPTEDPTTPWCYFCTGGDLSGDRTEHKEPAGEISVEEEHFDKSDLAFLWSDHSEEEKDMHTADTHIPSKLGDEEDEEEEGREKEKEAHGESSAALVPTHSHHKPASKYPATDKDKLVYLLHTGHKESKEEVVSAEEDEDHASTSHESQTEHAQVDREAEKQSQKPRGANKNDLAYLWSEDTHETSHEILNSHETSHEDESQHLSTEESSHSEKHQHQHTKPAYTKKDSLVYLLHTGHKESKEEVVSAEKDEDHASTSHESQTEHAQVDREAEKQSQKPRGANKNDLAYLWSEDTHETSHEILNSHETSHEDESQHLSTEESSHSEKHQHQHTKPAHTKKDSLAYLFHTDKKEHSDKEVEGHGHQEEEDEEHGMKSEESEIEDGDHSDEVDMGDTRTEHDSKTVSEKASALDKSDLAYLWAESSQVEPQPARPRQPSGNQHQHQHHPNSPNTDVKPDTIHKDALVYLFHTDYKDVSKEDHGAISKGETLNESNTKHDEVISGEFEADVDTGAQRHDIKEETKVLPKEEEESDQGDGLSDASSQRAESKHNQATEKASRQHQDKVDKSQLAYLWSEQTDVKHSEQASPEEKTQDEGPTSGLASDKHELNPAGDNDAEAESDTDDAHHPASPGQHKDDLAFLFTDRR